MAQFNKLPGFVEHLAHGVHNFKLPANGGDQLKIALSNTAPSAESNNPALNTANCVLANVTQISYANLAVGDQLLTISGSSQTGGVYKLSISDRTITATGGSVPAFRYIYIYNDTPTSPADPLIGYYDYGISLTLLQSDSFTIDFSDANGVLTLT